MSSAKRIRFSRSNESDQERVILLYLDSKRHVSQIVRESSVGRTVDLLVARERHKA